MPLNFFGEGTLFLSLGSGSVTSADVGAGPPGPSPWSDMSSESLLLHELSGLSADAAARALLDDLFCGESGNLPGVTVAAFASSTYESARSRRALSLARCLSASSIENYSLACTLAVALINRPCSSLVPSFPFLDLCLRGLLLLGPWDSSILTC